jgi:hypothetical protein
MEDYGQHDAEELLESELDTSQEETPDTPPPPEAPPILLPETQEDNLAPYMEDSSEVAVGGTAMIGQELQRRREEVKRRNEVAHFKKQAPDIEAEQEAISRQQTELGTSQQEQEAYDTLTHVTLPKLESSREKLHSRLEPNPPIEETEEVEIDLTTARAEQMIRSGHEPEEVMQTVELAAEQDIPIETAYERRHERKGEDTDDTGEAANEEQESASGLGSMLTGAETGQDTGLAQDNKQKVIPFTPGNLPQKPSLYIQAIKAGFWTAIALAALALVFVIIR